MWSEGSAKIWFFLFAVCLLLAAVASFGYLGKNSDVERLNDSYRILQETSATCSSQYNTLNTQYKNLTDTFTKMSVDYQKVVADYNKLVNDYNALLAKK
ncbi:MAG: hypothetical protein PHR56_05075 [Dehalococcoidales bacterium]|nr:hypothetical protein [Dehalococcoidales bacterium]